MILNSILLKSQQFLSAGECSIIYNGAFVQASSTLVYARASKNTVSYYYKETTEAGTERRFIEFTDNTFFAPHKFCGEPCNFNPKPTVDNTYVTVDPDLKIIFIESYLFRHVKESIVRNEYKNIIITNKATGVVISNADIRTLVSTFKKAVYKNFLTTVYSGKFLNRIFHTRDNAFYSNLKCFIPVTIECKYLFNPLLDDPEIHFRETRLYKEAVANRGIREVIPDGVMSTTLATHMEVCKSLHMNTFMRFTPQFLYKLCVGFITGGNYGFPNVNRKIKVASTKDYAEYGFKLSYTELQYMQEYEAVTKKSKNGDSSDLAALEYLQSYRDADTLWLAISLDRSKLIHYGTSVLDDRKNTTVNELYRYLQVARLYEEGDYVG